MGRALGGKKLDRKTVFKPSVIYRLLNDPFGVWCDYHAPSDQAVDEISRYEQIRMNLGVDFENQWVRKNYPEAVEIVPRLGIEALKNTIKAMLDGAPAIHGGALWRLQDDVYGQADVLIKCQGQSDLGDYHYRVKEIKRSKRVQEYHIYQAAIYNRMLGVIQGYVPDSFEVVLPDGEATFEYADAVEMVDKLLADWKAIRDGECIPEVGGLNSSLSPWRLYANKLLTERMDLALLPDVGPARREKLRNDLRIDGIRDLYDYSLAELRGRLGDSKGEKIFYSAQAYREDKPVIPPGNRIEIPRGRRNLYFDFETSDDLHRKESPHCYLIGLWDCEESEFVYFLAHGSEEEERIFREFIRYVGEEEDVVLGHWANYEIRVMREIARRHPGLAEDMDRLISCCVDFKEVVKRQVYLPVATYSIKAVAPILGFKWRQEDVGAMDSMVYYWNWLSDGVNEKIEKVIMYNTDDCVALKHIVEKLQAIATT